MPKKTPAKKKSPARKAKKVGHLQVETIYNYADILTPDGDRLFLCKEVAAKYFDILGMKHGDTREFKVTTEIVPEKKARKR